jgi:uncharacterized protein
MRAMPPVSTPCIDVCRLDHATGLCEGCGRSLDEIARWGSLTEEARKDIMAGLPARLSAAAARQGD